MKSETTVTGGILIEAKHEVGARVRRYAAQLPGPGLVVAQVERTEGRLRVVRAEAFPGTPAASFDLRADLEAYLNSEALQA